MKKDKRNRWMLGGLLAVVIGLAIWFLSPGPAAPSIPSGNGYYSGPMRSKSDPNAWITADGRRVPPPPDAIPLATTHAGSTTQTGKMFPSDDLPPLLPPGTDGKSFSGTQN